jgi:hypothetical protein
MRDWPTSPEFQQLAPLVVSREPAQVRRVLIRRERGELTLAETLAELERLPMASWWLERQRRAD